MVTEKLAYSVEEATEILGISRSLIYDKLRTGELRSIKIGRRRLITPEHLKGYLASLERAA